MATKKKLSDDFKDKILKHRGFTNKIAKDFSNTFFVNKLIGESLVSNVEGPDPFTFICTIEINTSITITSINVNGVIAKESDFKIKDEKIICEIKAFVSTFTFLLIIDAEGDALTTTTFNITCDGSKVFDEDQEIVITNSGRGGYSNPKVPLP